MDSFMKQLINVLTLRDDLSLYMIRSLIVAVAISRPRYGAFLFMLLNFNIHFQFRMTRSYNLRSRNWNRTRYDFDRNVGRLL